MAARLDRYVGRTLLGSWSACLLFLFILFVVVDLLVEVPDYLAAARERGIGLLEFLASWLFFHAISTPYLFVTVAPFATVIGCMFAITRLMGGNELMPMLFTGRSLFRVLRPALWIGVLSAVLMGVCWEFLIPVVSDRAAVLHSRLSNEEADPHRRVIVRAPDDSRRLLMATRYRHDGPRMEGVFLLERGTHPDDQVVVEAQYADWNPETRDWELTDGVVRDGQHRVPRATLAVAGLTPELLFLAGKQSKRFATELSYSDLAELRAMQPLLQDYVIAFHQHLTFPLSNLILLLLALPAAVSFERGSKLGRILAAILICGGYLVVDLTCQSLGQREHLHPVVASWVPSIVFGALGIVTWGGMRT
jgi:lipopolysaccharide export system permease protein